MVGGKIVREEIKHDLPAGVSSVPAKASQLQNTTEYSKTSHHTEKTQSNVIDTTDDISQSHHTRIVAGKVIREEIKHDLPAGISTLDGRPDSPKRAPSKEPQTTDRTIKEPDVHDDFIRTERVVQHVKMVGGKVVKTETTEYVDVPREKTPAPQDSQRTDKSSTYEREDHTSKSTRDTDIRMIGGKIIQPKQHHDRPAGISTPEDKKSPEKIQTQEPRASDSVTKSEHTRIVS
ncbi:unnamed protein product, partial [Nesidiocoris tenuis]